MPGMSASPTRGLPGPLASLVGAVRAHPRITVAIVILLVALVVMRLITPPLADVRDTVAGDCLAGSPLTISGNTAGEVNVVPGYATGMQRVQCAEPHIWESAGVVQLPQPPGTPYPVDTIEAEVVDACAAAFEAFVGRPLDGSSLSATAFYPIRDDWEGKDERRVACMVVDPAQPTVTGSLQGSGR